MASNDAPPAGEKRERHGNLGWLAGSSVQPRKRKEIEGVSAATMFEMQANLYHAQEHARQLKDGTLDPSEKYARRRAGFDVSGLPGGKNAGVDDRDKRDKLEIKSTSTRATECYQALERKAQLYEKLARGEADDDDNLFEVDFLRKEIDHGDERESSFDEPRERRGAIDSTGEAVGGTGGMVSSDMAQERERRRWEIEEHEKMMDEREAQEKRQQYKETVMELTRETKEERARAERIKQQKEGQSQQKISKLKEGFLKAQLKKKMAAAAAAKNKS